MIQKFIEGAKGLTRNPLSIIALFISLIYGFACLVLSTSISNLEGATERLPLIWFIILFPLVILISFIVLVIKHHEKLYSPSDFREDEAFIRTIDKNKVEEKRLNEISTLESAPETEQVNAESINNNSVENIVLTEKNEETDAKIAVKELSQEELLIMHANSEKWAIDALSLKYKTSFKRNSGINSSLGKFEFDAFATNASYAVEVKYWQATKSDKKLQLAIQNFLSKNEKIKRVYPNAKFIITLVYDNLGGINQENMTEFVQSLNNDAIVEFFDYNELKKHYE